MKVSSNVPRITVGMPVYNGERFLEEALRSVMSQDFDAFEVVISDNASTDRTAQICRDHAASDRRIRYYRNDVNVGSAPNYRRVFELARGTHFKWFAHDDICLPGLLSRTHSVLDEAPPHVVLVYPGCEFIDERGVVLPRASDDIESRSSRPHLRLARVLRGVSVGGPLWGLIRSESLRRTKLTGHVSYWDDLLLAELSLHGELRRIPDVLFQVRSYAGNAVGVASAQQGAAVLSDPDKANKRTRRALLAWNDPSKANRRIWLPVREERCVEYLKRVHVTALPVTDKVLCYLTVPLVTYWGRVAKMGGAWRRSLLAALASTERKEAGS